MKNHYNIYDMEVMRKIGMDQGKNIGAIPFAEALVAITKPLIEHRTEEDVTAVFQAVLKAVKKHSRTIVLAQRTT